jgi:hypothetical protein
MDKGASGEENTARLVGWETDPGARLLSAHEQRYRQQNRVQ